MARSCEPIFFLKTRARRMSAASFSSFAVDSVANVSSAVARSSFTETYGVVLGLYGSYSIHRESAVPTKIFYRGVDKALK